MKRKAKHLGLELIGLVLSLIVLIPFYMLIINSGKTKEEAALVGLSLPTEWNFLKIMLRCLALGAWALRSKTAYCSQYQAFCWSFCCAQPPRLFCKGDVGARLPCFLHLSCWACLFPGRLSQPTLFAIICICLHFGCGIGSLCRQHPHGRFPLYGILQEYPTGD